jgi:hypothetical protein
LAVIIPLALVLAASFAGCAGGDDPPPTTTTAAPSTTTSPPTTEPPGEELFVFSLGPGECFDERIVIEGGDVEAEEGEQVARDFRIDCSLPHQNEVFVVLEHPAPPAQPYATDEELTQFVADNCHNQFESYVGQRYELSELEVGARLPTPEQWVNEGERQIVCYLFVESGEKVTGSVAGSGR